MFLTDRQIKFLSKGKRVVMRRAGVTTIIKRTTHDSKAAKIHKRIAKLRLQLRGLK